MLDIHTFRKTMHRVFCGKENETSRCPADCPFRSRNLRPDNWGKIRLKEMLEVKPMDGKRKEIQEALISLGYSEDDVKHIFIKKLAVLDDSRARVYVNQVRIGIYDFDRHTFVD